MVDSMLLAKSYYSGESFLFIPCGIKMRNDRSVEKSGQKKVRKYQRILPRPTEAYGQPLSIITKKEGATSGCAFKVKLISGAQGEWCHPTQPSMAIYNEPKTNVFLRLQNEPIPSTSQDDETYELPLIQAIGAPDDTPLYTVDSSYLHFFVSEFPSILSIDHLFPNALGRILGMTIGNPALWHSVLALSSFLADKIVGRPASRTYIHLYHSLPLIQSAIQNGTINDSHIAAVFCLAYRNMATGEVASAGRHLDGLVLMLEQRGATDPEDNPLINAIRRLTIRFDNVRGTTGRSLAFATNKLETGVSHREWLVKLMEPDKLNAIDWAIAEFELEDLANQMIHLDLRARTLRSSTTHNPATDEHELLFRAEVLLNELERWKLRPIFMAAEADENLSRRTGLGQSTAPSFLNYPPLPFKNIVYASLLILYYRLEILGSLIIRPQVGPEPPERVEAAVNLCRTFASYKAVREKVSSLMVIPLTFAGFVLGETTHPQEFEWICEQLADIDRMSGLASAAVAVSALRTIWRNPEIPFWDIFFQKLDT